MVLLPCERRKGIPPYTPAYGGNCEEKIVGSYWDEQGCTLEPDDPRWLSSTLAPIPPPPTEKIATELKSRFQ